MEKPNFPYVLFKLVSCSDKIHVITFILLLFVPLAAANQPQNVTGHQRYWGFFGHKLINKQAVFLLPEEMFGFYKQHIQFLAERSVLPDSRRYVVKGEAPRHYIDLDVYGDSSLWKMPRSWEEAVRVHSEDTLMKYGIVPWHIVTVKKRLTWAFKSGKTDQIIKLSAELGHYVGDANVPLHTTENYNGQLTGQHGIHGLWESRLPELMHEDYDLFQERAEYLKSPQATAWEAVTNAHLALDSVLQFELLATEKIGGEQFKYSFEERNGRTVRVYAQKFCRLYHSMLAGQVERRLRASIKMVADFWYTCWVDAGSPPLPNTKVPNLNAQEQWDSLQNKTESRQIRPHEGAESGN